jgi:hypothetical protein
MAWTFERYLVHPTIDPLQPTWSFGNGGSPDTHLTEPKGSLHTVRDGAADAILYVNTDGATAWSNTDVGAMAVSNITIARGFLMRGSAAGVGEAVDLAAAQGIAFSDGNDIVRGTIDDHGAITPAGSVDSSPETIDDHGAITPAGSSDAAGGVLDVLPYFSAGAWAVDGDGVQTNGGGLVGEVPALNVSYCKVYDFGTTTWDDVSTSSTLPNWTADWQLTADAANEEVNDAFAIGYDIPFCEFGVDLSALATWGGDGMIYEYSTGAGAWSTLPVAGGAGEGYDNTDTTAQDGLRSLQQVGAMVFSPPSDWAVDTIDGQVAYWIRGRITALQVTQTPVLNAAVPDIVVGEQGWRPPHDGALTALTLTDQAATLHSTQDVIFVLYSSTTGETRSFTFAQDRRRQRITCTSWDLSTTDHLHLFVVQEDTAAEPSNVGFELEFNIDDHQHAMTAVTVTPPAHAGMGHVHAVTALTVTPPAHNIS